MEDQGDKNTPTLFFTLKPNDFLNTSVYRHEQNAKTGFFRLSDSPTCTISSTNSLTSTCTVFKDTHNRILAEIHRKDLAKDSIAFRNDSQSGGHLMKEVKFNEWLENDFRSPEHGPLIWIFDDTFNLVLYPQSDRSQILARVEQISDNHANHGKSTLRLSIYFPILSPELEVQILASFTYLEHMMALRRKSTTVYTAMGQTHGWMRSPQ